MKNTEVVTVESMLAKFRSGYKDTKLNYGDFSVPIRILNAKEESLAIIEGKEAIKGPNSKQSEQMEALSVMKVVLFKAAYIDSTPHLPNAFLDQLSPTEIEVLYDQYLELAHQVNPEFEDLSHEEVREAIAVIKKKDAKARDLSTRQLKGIGLYFLEEILPMVKEHGSN